MLRIATVFSGIGSIEHALKRMGIHNEIIFACDNGDIDPWKKTTEAERQDLINIINNETDHIKRKKMVDDLYFQSKKTNYVKKTYLENYQIEEDRFFQDVTLLSGKPFYNQVDLFVGGSPCQSFSTAGKQGGLEDTRGTLFYEYARLVKEIQPKVFIYENVQGMFKHDKGKTWKIIKDVFESLGYTYYYKIMNAKDYGIPQNRRRLFVIGFKSENINFEFPKERTLNKTMQEFLLENCEKKYYFKKRKDEERNGYKLEDKYFLSEKLIKTVMSSGTKGYYSKPEIDLKIARPLLSTMAKMHRAGMDNYVTTNGKIRRLTPREALRLMGYCDSFKQVVSDSQMYKQAGNSIVVDVLIAVMKEVMKTNVFEKTE